MTVPNEVKEGSSVGIKVTFLEKSSDDPEGSPVVPNAGAVWKLTDAEGNIVNNRENQSLPVASTVTIVIGGADTTLNNDYPAMRYITVEAEYNSMLGEDLVIVDEVPLKIIDLKGK